MAPTQKNAGVSYPSFSLSDEKATAFLKESDAEVGDVFTATVRIEVTGMRDDQYGKSLTLDVVELNDISKTDDADDEEADEGADDSDAEEADEPKSGKPNKAVRKMMKEEA